MPPKPFQLAIIGGGAKAVAIAAKAAVLRKKYGAILVVTIFEKSEIGANWSGRHGYTTGESELCTPAERDLGFPYKSGFGTTIDKLLFAEYSWGAFAVAKERKYGDWVDAGRGRPSHKVFAEYLVWARKKSRAVVEPVDVKRLEPIDQKWRVHGLDNAGNNVTSAVDFDGVVVTGPGAPRPLKGIPKHHSRVFDGADFWSRIGEVKHFLDEIRKAKEGLAAQIPPSPEGAEQLGVVVVGGGGTGAAALAWLVQNSSPDLKLHLVANQATIHGRADNPFENRIFSEAGIWSKISVANREKFYDRLTRGIVWDNVIDQLKNADIQPIDGMATHLEDCGNFIRVHYTLDKQQFSTEGAFVIDATGFNAWWFTELLKPQDNFRWNKTQRKRLKSTIKDSLHFDGPLWPFPLLHAPNLASDFGPGFGSLMTLGILSDSILERYLDPESLPN